MNIKRKQAITQSVRIAVSESEQQLCYVTHEDFDRVRKTLFNRLEEIARQYGFTPAHIIAMAETWAGQE